MRFDDWERIYAEIVAEMGFDRSSDEASSRLLKSLTQMSNLIDDDEIADMFMKEVVVIGPASPDMTGLEGKLVISAGSATETVMESIVPDIVVTDLDGDIATQIGASSKGAITFIHAHGDNTDLIQRHVKDFKGPIILTTQSTPDNVIRNYGGFTDGDRAVCIAVHFGAKAIELRGFDFGNPVMKDGSDIETKRTKLRWAKRIISEYASVIGPL